MNTIYTVNYGSIVFQTTDTCEAETCSQAGATLTAEVNA